MIPLRSVIEEARTALVAQPLRTGLASLGIVVGIATVIAALAVGEGARRSAMADIGSLGVENVYVRAVAESTPGRRPLAPVLTRADADAIAGGVPGVVSVAVARIGRAEVVAGGRPQTVPLVGVTPSWDGISGVSVLEGRWLTPIDERGAERVAVLGASLADRLGAGATAGTAITVNGETLRVIGTLRRPVQTRSGASMQLFDADAAVFVPTQVMDLRLGEGDDVERVSIIAVRTSTGADPTATATQIDRMLGRRHDGGSRWELIVPRELLRAKLRAQQTFDAVLLAVGLLALLISGVGIMNIMLATVAERTQEIGVRRALGARRREILAQFALEAGLLCGAGGAAGVPLGIALAWMAARLAGWPVALSPAGTLIGLVLATGVGLTFGIYPARKAAAVDPIDALRAS